MSDVLGINDVTLTRTYKRKSRKYGESSVEVYEGERSVALAFYNSKLNDATYDEVTFDHREAVGVVELVTADPDNSYDPDTDAVWELDTVEVQKQLLEAPYFDQYSGAFPDESIVIETALAQGETLDVSDFTGWGKRYWGLRRSGVETWPEELPVIRKTYIETTRTVAQEDFSRSGYVVLAIDNLPQLIQNKISQFTILNFKGNDNPNDVAYQPNAYQWLQRKPRMRSIEGGKKWEVSIEWWGAYKWAKVLYGPDAGWDPQA